ncbi:MAG: hypothetical protein Q7U02_15110 [Desulfosalsimonadaceae bacterium]|nr:hypothetical protein [Desulfosalsimonadaceae bacterium]
MIQKLLNIDSTRKGQYPLNLFSGYFAAVIQVRPVPDTQILTHALNLFF